MHIQLRGEQQKGKGVVVTCNVQASFILDYIYTHTLIDLFASAALQATSLY